MQEETKIMWNLFVLVFIAGLMTFMLIIKLDLMASLLSLIMLGAIGLAGRFLYQKSDWKYLD